MYRCHYINDADGLVVIRFDLVVDHDSKTCMVI